MTTLPSQSSLPAALGVYTTPLVTTTSAGLSSQLGFARPMSQLGFSPFHGGYSGSFTGGYTPPSPSGGNAPAHHGGYPPMHIGGYPPMPAGLAFLPAASSSSGTLGVINITSSITIRLTCKNYLFWKAQVGPLLRSNLLMGYVDGSLPCPPTHTVIDHGGIATPVPNPAYQHWIQQDQAILSAFVSSMTEGVVGMVMFAGTSREAWETLASTFAATSFAHSSGLRQQMAELKKCDMTVNVYFHKMKALADELTSMGQPLRDDELISYILAGLPKEFDALYEVVNNCTTPMQVQDLYS
jgi:hypothetical protein